MQIAIHVEAVQNDLAAVAAAANAEESETVRRLTVALDASLLLRLLEAVTAAALELSAQLSAGRVDVRLEDGDPKLVLVEDEPAPAAVPLDDSSARITLRLPEGLKARVEQAAAREGVSTNTWLVQAIARSVEARPRVGNRLSGFARS